MDTSFDTLKAYVDRVRELDRRYRAGDVHVHVPDVLLHFERPIEDVVQSCLPASYAALQAARQGLFLSLPIAFDPAASIGCYLATADRDAQGNPYRFLDMGAQIATRAFGENDPALIEAVLAEMPSVVNRYAHSEYQTTLSLRLKEALGRIAPRGTPRHFVVNTGAEAVENAIKASLLHRVLQGGVTHRGVIVSFDGAFHGRTLGALAVTHRKRARTGFPTFEWPQALFPTDDPRAPAATLRREERSLRQIYDLIVSGKGGVPKDREAFRRELDAIDAFLAETGGDAAAFVATRRQAQAPEALQAGRTIAAVLIEPIQGEGGVRKASPRFFRRLRMLTATFDVPLIFDEVQTGFGTTGHMWAHESFDLPLPPDVVTWAKKAQNGVLFVSDELATFFQEEKKFNTTWEGDSTGMVRLLSMIDRLDLEQVRRTGEQTRARLDTLARKYRDFVQRVRGSGVMWGFDVARSDLRDAVRDRAFRRGLLMLSAGERTLRFYPRHDTPEPVLDEAITILRAAIEDVVHGHVTVVPGPLVRVGSFEAPVASLQVLDLNPQTFAALRTSIMNVEMERYGSLEDYPSDVLRAGRRPLLQFPADALESTLGNADAIGIALRDGVSDRVVAYAVGSPIENHDEEGVTDDPHFGENVTFYLLAAATSPSVANRADVEQVLFTRLLERVTARGFQYFSTLIEEDVLHTGLRNVPGVNVLQSIDDYLQSERRFVYAQVPLVPAPVSATTEAS